MTNSTNKNIFAPFSFQKKRAGFSFHATKKQNKEEKKKGEKKKHLGRRGKNMRTDHEMGEPPSSNWHGLMSLDSNV